MTACTSWERMKLDEDSKARQRLHYQLIMQLNQVSHLSPLLKWRKSQLQQVFFVSYYIKTHQLLCISALNWLNIYNVSHEMPSISNIFQAFTNKMELDQCDEQFTTEENILDLLFLNYFVNVIACNILSLITTSDHSVVFLVN